MKQKFRKLISPIISYKKQLTFKLWWMKRFEGLRGIHVSRDTFNIAYKEEDACKEILAMLEGKVIEDTKGFLD